MHRNRGAREIINTALQQIDNPEGHNGPRERNEKSVRRPIYTKRTFHARCRAKWAAIKAPGGREQPAVSSRFFPPKQARSFFFLLSPAISDL